MNIRAMAHAGAEELNRDRKGPEPELDDKTKLLDHGYVRLIDKMGNDLSIVRAARVSYDAAWRSGEDEGNDRRLLRRLWRGKTEKGNEHVPLPELPKHSTPFEAVTLTFEVMAPIFVFRQWQRHRTQSYNELSARYRELPETFFIPTPDDVGVQSSTNKQGRAPLPTADWRAQRKAEIEMVYGACKNSFAVYHRLLQSGWPNELARICLPFGTYSHMFTTMNLLNFFKFANLRADEHAQKEIRVYAEAMIDLIEPVVPYAASLFREANPQVPQTV